MSLNAFVAVERLVNHPTLVAHRAALPVLLILAGASNDDGLSWCTLGTIRKRTGMGLTTVKTHLTTLEEGGLMVSLDASEVPADLERDGDSRVRRVPIVRPPYAKTAPIEGVEARSPGHPEKPGHRASKSPVTGPRGGVLMRGPKSPATGPSKSPATGPQSSLEPEHQHQTPGCGGSEVARVSAPAAAASQANPAEPSPPSKADRGKADAWDLWCRLLAGGHDKATPAERVVIEDAVTRYGLEHTRAAISSLADTDRRPKASYVLDRAKASRNRERERSRGNALVEGWVPDGGLVEDGECE